VEGVSYGTLAIDALPKVTGSRKSGFGLQKAVHRDISKELNVSEE
jgi:hypothetical protein